VGIRPFLGYVRPIRRSLADYNCEISACVTEFPHAFARMRFSGVHVESFRGFAPTGKLVHWEGAAFFTFRGDLIASLWVLGDLVGLDAVLRVNASA
jgi:predicted ester cyclase